MAIPVRYQMPEGNEEGTGNDELEDENDAGKKGERDSLPRPGLKSAYCREGANEVSEAKEEGRGGKEEGRNEDEPGNTAGLPGDRRDSTRRGCSRCASSLRRGRLPTTFEDPR